MHYTRERVKMFEKVFGKKKSIQRSLIRDTIISIIIVVIISIIGFYVFVNREALKTLVQVNLESKEKLKDLLDIIQRSIFILVMNVIVISAVVMKLASRKMLKPIQQIAEATKKVSLGDFKVRLETKRNDEIGELTNNFNQMVKELGSIELLQKDFINNVSHEIKTPITSIQGFAKLLEDDNISKEEKQEYLNIIVEESNRLLNISTNILRLSKLQNQEKITKKDIINVTEQIRKTISLLEPKWKEKNLSFDISTQEIYYYGDEEITFQIWVNLIDNAIKFSEENGKISIKIKQEDCNIVVKIKDNGIGMDENEQQKIYTRFYQIDQSHSQEGSGLGLSIVKRIVDLSNGKIEVESKKNVGTTFTIKLPVEKENNKIVIE